VIDLHTHSSVSDGSDPPEQLVAKAAAAGLNAVALTDHDSLGGLGLAEEAAASSGIRLVRGCEISCKATLGTAHVLCYFVEDEHGPLQDELIRLQHDRESRNAELLSRLIGLGLPVTAEEVAAEAGGRGVGRPHFAAVLVRNGAAESIDDAFARYLAKGAPAYVPKARLEVGRVVELAEASGALAVLAHPLSLGLDFDELDATIAAYARAGLAGLECYYGRYDVATRSLLANLARRHGLVATGGSDYHGAYKPDLEIGTGTGDLAVSDEVLEALEARRPERSGQR
jgi:predicted metal-dependent phosphoesterase TrpH